MLDLETNYTDQNFVGITMPKAEEVSNNVITLKTRFGVMEIDRDKTIKLPQGIVGFSEYKEYGLSVPSHALLDGYMLLQSVEEADLTFILKPYDLSSGEIEDNDLAAAMNQYAIAPENLAVMLVTTLRQTPNAIQKTVNLRAPVFIDTEKKQAWQHILNSEKYNVRHPVN